MTDDAARRHESFLVRRGRTGYRGVYWDASKLVYKAEIYPQPDQPRRRLGRFATAIEAAKAYDDAARELYGIDARLNFPRDGEKGTIPSRRSEGLCPHGHSLVDYGYVRPDGRGTNCRECQRLARYRKTMEATL